MAHAEKTETVLLRLRPQDTPTGISNSTMILNHQLSGERVHQYGLWDSPFLNHLCGGEHGRSPDL